MRAIGSAQEADHVCDGSARTRPPLCHRRHQDSRANWDGTRRARLKPDCGRRWLVSGRILTGWKDVRTGAYLEWIRQNYEERMARMKGIILAGGSGTRLYPVTHVVSKQLLPVYDKPMIYYPLSTLMLAGIARHPDHLNAAGYGALCRSCWATAARGASISAMPCSPAPTGWRRHFSSAREFIGGDASALVLGDNIFYGQSLSKQLQTRPRR